MTFQHKLTGEQYNLTPVFNKKSEIVNYEATCILSQTKTGSKFICKLCEFNENSQWERSD